MYFIVWCGILGIGFRYELVAAVMVMLSDISDKIDFEIAGSLTCVSQQVAAFCYDNHHFVGGVIKHGLCKPCTWTSYILYIHKYIDVIESQAQNMPNNCECLQPKRWCHFDQTLLFVSL